MPFLLTQQGSTFRPFHLSRAAPCLPCTQQTQAPSRPCLAVWAKKVAASELRQLSEDDLLKQVAKSQYEIVQLQWKQSRKEAITTSDLRWHKKHIARLLTVKREREIKQGIDQRTSRNMEKREKLADGQAHLPGRMYWMNDKYLKLVPDDSE